MPPELRDYRGHIGRRISLRDLRATFIRLTEIGWWDVDTLAQAQGLYFLCPKCFTFNGGAVGTHICITWFTDRGVPDDHAPGPGRWSPSDSSSCIDDLTFVPKKLSHSILLTGGCGWHGYVRSGAIESDA